ncbi:MAG: hypothetical protein PHD74_00830 [Candidatus Krumholzibacteria bacterium]|nr:hypothetical protein [Candidatus Krumholzibacteria bacterium]
MKLENGLEIRLYSPKNVLEMSTRDGDGRLILTLSDGVKYELIDDICDPRIVNRGDGSFHPVNEEWVIDALGKVDVSGEKIKMSVNVYVLPFPRSGLLASSSCDDCIFLSPGVREIARRAVACTATHEFGHVFQGHFAPEGSGGRWADYLRIRGLKDSAVYSVDASHMNRPAEIFAEDFRYLFGGAEACSSGKIENCEIPLPDAVSGLREFFVALVEPAGFEEPLALSNYPNPFNPSTTIRVALASLAPEKRGEIDLAIYRADGSLVRNLYRGAVSGDELTVTWDGRDGRGMPVSSGMYFYAVRSAAGRAAGKMLLLR